MATKSGGAPKKSGGAAKKRSVTATKGARTAKKRTRTAKEVKILADGTRRVVLMFPAGSPLKLKKKVSFDALAKILGEAGPEEVEGQCWQHRCTLAAIGGVRG